MNRRDFIQYSSLATFGMVTEPAFAGFSKTGNSDQNISEVHLIFKTHLDIGFTDLAGNVIKTYMNEFIPKALTLSENTRNSNLNNRFIWTTGSWLIYQFLEKSEQTMRRRMEKAIENEDIVWHGLPFTTHTELADPNLFELGIQLSARLDNRFGKETIAAKMTDVPGHTRSLIPILAKNNIQFLHIGVNPASTPPDVPPLFVWHAPDGSEIVVMYQKDYGSLMSIPGTDTVVAINFTSDNHGPQTPEQIAKIYDDLRKKYPNADIKASTFNHVANVVSSVRAQLPVVTQELGDTWIHGAASDPLKIARFRELSRYRTNLLRNKTIKFGDETDLAAGIPLLMVAEHTWGLDVKTWLNDWDIYKPEDFIPSISKPKFKLMEKSWDEKRQYINDSLAQLPANLKEIAEENLAGLKPIPATKSGYLKIDIPNNVIDSQFFELKIDPKSGGIIKLKDKSRGFDWANENNPLCQFAYQTFSADDYKKYHEQYLTQKIDWAYGDFGKTGQEIGHAVSRTWLPTLKGISKKADAEGEYILLDLVVVDENGVSVGGCARNIEVELFFPRDKKEFHANLQWFNKMPYRLPEASWFSFVPAVENGDWIIDKMGQPVNFSDVVKNGNRKLHAIFNDVKFESPATNCAIESLDAPLVAPGERNLLNFDNQLPKANEGMHFCLHNNVWGTNFMMWFGDDMKYRFVFKA